MIPWNKDLITDALEAGADAVIVPQGTTEKVKELGIIQTVSEDGDIKWEKDIVYADVHSQDDEEAIVSLSRSKKVIVNTSDWTIIPLENLVAQTQNIFVECDNLDDARTSLGILEKGVDGVIITQSDPIQAREIIKCLKSETDNIDLVSFTIDAIRPLGMGDRVCVDTCTLMEEGEGCLIGNSSRAMFLVHSESIENPYVSPRPFRVNAGPVHAYIKIPGGRTRYLSELKAGDEVLGVDSSGKAKSLTVGRLKIEQRPLLLIEGTGPNGPVNTILQNAETIRLVDMAGKAVSVVKLKPGDTVLGMVESTGRHFGHQIDETITEK
ncbi:MAG: 3-dehydroquinate synthase [Candidatus Magnetoglobus multicellularis str. Araruama]|uniref:3-dehydroquinate synthase n=1 Tax=Candidatus Magnetoglobus multicellularis str. Araruama TaxID=890399 RepID=A0A1V1P0X9_9BACT|nr:MAG: 3-dehydroquinate synthase [Candidatus Magnetoglobus multicellularis str. Araruama]